MASSAPTPPRSLITLSTLLPLRNRRTSLPNLPILAGCLLVKPTLNAGKWFCNDVGNRTRFWPKPRTVAVASWVIGHYFLSVS